MLKIAAAVVVIIAAGALYLFFSNSHASPIAQVGDGKISPSDFSVAVQGWRAEELRTIITQFEGKYDLAADTFAIEQRNPGTLLVRTTKDIDAADAFFLVNYIMYPENFDLTHRTLAAVGEIELSDETGLPAGTKAYVRLDNRHTYRVSFTNMGWELVRDQKLPALARALIQESGTTT